MKRSIVAFTLAACVVAAGCATGPGALSEFDLRRAVIVTSTDEAPRLASGARGRGVGAAGGAVAGAAGALASSLSCLALGPFAPACFAAAGTVAVVAGVTGAAIGAANSDGVEEYEAKQTVLRAAAGAWDPRERLVFHLQEQSRASVAIELPVVSEGSSAAGHAWRLALRGVTITTIGIGAGAPYALQASAQLIVTRGEDPKPMLSKQYQSASRETMPAAQWGANDGARARTEIDALLLEVATRMLGDLLQAR